MRLTSTCSLRESTPAPSDESQNKREPAHSESEQDEGPRECCGHDVDIHTESGSEDEQGVQSSYRKRQKRYTCAWLKVQLRRARIESSVPSVNGVCVVCDNPAVIVCYDCGTEALYCENCTESIQIDSIHSR